MIKKQFLETACKVTFEVLQDATQAIHSVHLIGDFNEWNPASTPMVQKKDAFTVTLTLEPHREYQFRYLINGSDWQNDAHADGYRPNPFGSDNSVLRTWPTT